METSTLEKNVNNKVEEMENLRKKKDYEGAILKLDETLKVLQEAPQDNQDVINKTAVILGKKVEINKIIGKWNEAAVDLDKIFAISDKINQKSELVKANICKGEFLSYSGEFAESIIFFESALEVAKENNVPEELALCYYHLGSINARIGEHQKGKELIDQSMELLKGKSDNKEARSVIAMCLTQVGLQFFRKGKYDDAISNYEKAIIMLEDKEDSLEKAEPYRYIGVIHSIKSNYREALGYHQKALQIVANAKYLFGMAKVYNSIGQLCLDVQKLDEALFFMEKTERICTDLKADAESATIFGKLGHVYMQKEDYENAVKYHLRDLEMCKRFGNYRALAHTYRNLGLSYLRSNQRDKAISYLKEGLERFKELQETVNIGRIYIDMCYAYLEEDNLALAEEMGKSAMESLDKYTQSPDTAYAKTLCGVIARKKKDFDTAYRYFTESMEILGWKEPSTKLIETHHELGILYLETEDLKKALVNFKIALRTARDMGLKKQVEKNLRVIEKIDEMEIVNIILEEL